MAGPPQTAGGPATAGSAGSKNSRQPKLECTAIGTVSAQDAPALRQLLQGLSGLPGLQVLQHCLALKGPQHDRSAPELRLIHTLATAPITGCARLDGQSFDRWLVRHEGLPMRGRGVADLPALVRSVTTTHCIGQDVIAFWHGLGFQLSYEMVYEGERYVLFHNSVQIEILLARVYRLEVQNALDSKIEISPGHLYVEVISKSVEGEHVSAAQAIGSFGELLAPLCELRKP